MLNGNKENFVERQKSAAKVKFRANTYSSPSFATATGVNNVSDNELELC